MHAVTYQQHSLPHEEDLNYPVPWSLCSYRHVAVTPLSTTTSHQNSLVQLSKLTNTFPENKIHCLPTDKNLLPVFLLSHLSSISLWNMQLSSFSLDFLPNSSWGLKTSIPSMMSNFPGRNMVGPQFCNMRQNYNVLKQWRSPTFYPHYQAYQ